MRWIIVLLTLRASAAHVWNAAPHVPSLPCFQLRARATLQLAEPHDASSTGAATGQDVPKTDGIPNYMLRTSGTIARLAEGPASSTAVHDDGVLYEPDRILSILTSDVIDMVQQQGGTAEKIDYLGENILIDGMLFDDFQAHDTFDIASPGSADDDVVVTVQIVEPRPSSELELGQLGDDEGKRRSVASIVSLAPGFSGWSARVVEAGRVRAGFKIAKRHSA